MKIGVLGPKGTFSDLALKIYQKDHLVTPYYYQTLDQTLTSLDNHDKIIVPLENTLEGYVQPILDYMINHHVHIESELVIPVQYAFISHAKDISLVKHVYVQFAAKSQCQQFINQYHLSTTLTESNVQSYERLIDGTTHDGAIIPVHMVDDQFPLRIEHIADVNQNETRFIILSKSFKAYHADRLKFSIVVRPTQDRPGLLYDILKIFKDNDINLSAIMSRPQKTKLGQYYFYIECLGESNTTDKVTHAISMIRQNFDVSILGIYPI